MSRRNKSVKRPVPPERIDRDLNRVIVSSIAMSLGAGVLFGLALSVASTVVLLRALESRNALETFNGRIAVGWLIVQDLVMVLVLVLLPPLATLLGGSAGEPDGGRGLGAALGITLAKMATFVVLMVVVGRRLFPRILWLVAKTGSRELFTLCIVAAAVGSVGSTYGSR